MHRYSVGGPVPPFRSSWDPGFSLQTFSPQQKSGLVPPRWFMYLGRNRWASFRRGDSQQKRLVKGEPGIWAPRFFRCSREIRSWMVQGICLFHLFMWENGIIAIWTIHEFLVFRNGAIGVTSRVVFFCGSCRSEGCFIPDNRSSCASMCWHWTIP